jgi:hypothetical protein
LDEGEIMGKYDSAIIMSRWNVDLDAEQEEYLGRKLTDEEWHTLRAMLEGDLCRSSVIEKYVEYSRYFIKELSKGKTPEDIMRKPIRIIK